MAKTTISSSDLTTIRTTAHQLTAVRINTIRPEVVATYSITPGTTAVITDISGTLSSGSVSDILLGRRVKLTDGTYNQWSTVRKSSDASNLYINAIGEGQTGFSEPIAPAQSSLTTAQVYNDFPMFGEWSRVVSKSKPILPRWDLAFAGQTSTAIPPIANAGCHQSASIAVGGTATFTLPRSGSNSSFAFGSETISTHLWTLPTGVSFASGYSSSDAVIEVDATVGQHLITYTVTDSNSQTHTAYVWLFVDDGSTYKTLTDEFQARIFSHTAGRDGHTIEMDLSGQIDDTVLLKGGMIHIQTDQTFGGSTITDGVIVDTYVGYIQNIVPLYDGSVYNVRLTVVSPAIYLQSVATAPQVIFEKSSPSNWTQVTSDLSNPRGALSYIRWQCQNLFALHDIDCSLTEPRKKSYQFAGTTIASHFDDIAQAIVGNVGSAADGSLVVRKNPVFRDNTFRNALATGCTFTESDIVGEITYNDPVHAVFQDVRSGGFAYNGSKLKAWYGVKRWGQGAGKTELPNFTVTSSEGRDEVLQIVGHMAQDANHPTTQTVQLSRDFTVFDPVYMIWYALNVSSTYDARGNGWSNIRILPESVSISWDLAKFTRTSALTFKQETFGQPAEEYFLPSSKISISNGWGVSFAIPFQPALSQFGVLPNLAVLLNTSGQLAVTQNLLASSPNYLDLSNYVTGTVCDVCYDYNSAFFTSGYVLTEILSLYIVSASGTTLYVYRLDDIKASSFTVTQLTTYTMDDSSTTTTARIACSRTTPTFAIVGFHDQTGVRVGRSTDGGTTWGSLTRVGSSITDTINDDAELGMYISGTNQLISAPDASSDYGIYLATTTGGAFSKLTNSQDRDFVQPFIVGDGNTTLYVSMKGGIISSATYESDFDGGYSATVSNVNATSAGSSATGNPGNAAYGQVDAQSNYTFNHRFDVDITLGGSETVTYITFDMFHNLDYTDAATGAGKPTKMYADVTYTGGGGGSPSVEVVHDTCTFQTTDDLLWTKSGEWHSYAIPVQYTTVTAIAIEIGIDGADNDFDVNTNSQIRIDNIAIYVSGEAQGNQYYKVTTYTTTDSWGDVSPAVGYAPLLPYGQAIDIVDTDNLEAFVNGVDDSYYSSTNAASAWVDEGTSDYRTGIKAGNIMFLAGSNAFDITDDDGTTLLDKLGDLSLAWGSVGVIKRILAVLSE